MRVYLKQNVFDAALERIRWLFAEFPNIVVAYSGGKDSTVVFELTLRVAREKNRLPLSVMWIDQEAEWQATVDQAEYVMTHPDVKPYWYQIPMRLFNATSTTEHWLNCWDPADENRWMRPHHPLAITENRYGTDRFSALFDAIIATEWAGIKTALVGGVRCEESPSRTVALTHSKTYKWATWGKVLSRGSKTEHYTMYPIYDWSYTDIWAAIFKNGWNYNRIYDVQYAHGVSVLNMRVSNVHHETAVGHLFYMQEAEPETYERLTQRIAGVDTAGKLGVDDYFVNDLPSAFGSWSEYRNYLLENLISNEDWKATFRKRFDKMDALYIGLHTERSLCRVQITSILTNDWEGIKLTNFENSPRQVLHRKKINRPNEVW